MQPLKITITGDFWDCQIYRGRLYLWSLDGGLKIYDWHELIDSIVDSEKNYLATSCAFLKGNYLYGHHDIFEDSDFKKLLFKKFQIIEKLQFQISIKDAAKFLIGEQDNPFKDLPTDTEISSNKLFAITDDGFWSTTAHRGKSARYPVSSRPIKLWDNRLLSITANRYATIALSSGEEGLFQYEKNKDDSGWYPFEEKKGVEKEIIQLSDKHSLFNDWNNLSIYSSSDISESYLSLFEWEMLDEKRFNRKFSKSISEDKIFEGLNLNGSLSWGAGDKIYKTTKKGIVVTRFNNNAKSYGRDDNYFSEPELIELNKLDGEVIDAKVCLFGTIIESENSLTVLQSDGGIFKINEPVTRWRIYPRSKNYENHLHVILDDRLEIYSFNHDYFVNQSEKKIGIRYK